MLEFVCGIVVAILKMVIGRNYSMSGINSGRHYLPYQILMISDNVEFLPPTFYAMFWQPFWKWQTSWKFWRRRIAPLMVTYHYCQILCLYHYPFRAVPEKSMSHLPPQGRQLIFFSMGRHANENLNSVGGRFERNFNFIGGRCFRIQIIAWVVGNIKLFYGWWVTAMIY